MTAIQSTQTTVGSYCTHTLLMLLEYTGIALDLLSSEFVTHRSALALHTTCKKESYMYLRVKKYQWTLQTKDVSIWTPYMSHYGTYMEAIGHNSAVVCTLLLPEHTTTS